MRTLLLGLGNDLYGDDGVGIYAVRKMREDAQKRGAQTCQQEDVEMEVCPLSGLALLDVIIGYDRLILVDTIKRKDPKPGRIHLLEGNELRAIPGPSPHYVSVPQAIALGRKLGLHVPSRIQVVAVEAKAGYSLGEGLSAEMKRKLPAIIRKVRHILAHG
jgi:hydrogenase maturation protease